MSDELKSTRSAGDAARGELEEKLAQAATAITLLHHSLQGLTDELHASLMDQVTTNALIHNLLNFYKLSTALALMMHDM